MEKGLLEKLLRETTDKDVTRRNKSFFITQRELLEREERMREGISIHAEYGSLYGVSSLGASVHKPNHAFDPISVETIAHEFVGKEVGWLRLYVNKDTKRRRKCFDLHIGKGVQSLTWSDTFNEQLQWIQENEALFREILGIFNGADITWKEDGTVLPNEHEARITPERIRDVYTLLFEHNLYPNIQSSTTKRDEKSSDTGLFYIRHHPWEGNYSSEICFERWLHNVPRDYRTIMPKDIAAVEEGIELLGETLEGKTFSYSLENRRVTYRVETGNILFVKDDHLYVGNTCHDERTIKNLISHYFRAFCFQERATNLREMLQYGTFNGFIHGVMKPPVTINLNQKNNLDFLFGYNTGITYRRMLDNRTERNMAH